MALTCACLSQTSPTSVAYMSGDNLVQNTVLIMFLLILHTINTAKMLSIGGEGAPTVIILADCTTVVVDAISLSIHPLCSATLISHRLLAVTCKYGAIKFSTAYSAKGSLRQKNLPWAERTPGLTAWGTLLWGQPVQKTAEFNQ